MINLNHDIGPDWLRDGGDIKRHPFDISTDINHWVDTGVATAANREPPRAYLGASMLGHPCMRYLVYYYRNRVAGDATIGASEPAGRMRRIWDRGHDAESRIIRHLRFGGFDVRNIDVDGNQFRFSQVNGKISGGIDGIVYNGPIPLPYPLLLEIKNINNASWNHLVKHGLEKSKEIYHAQVHLYMAYFGLENCLFCAENADTCDRLWLMVPYDRRRAQEVSDKAVAIVTRGLTSKLPDRIARNEDYYICRMCERWHQCWKLDRDA
jgi:hypothetical protein